MRTEWTLCSCQDQCLAHMAQRFASACTVAYRTVASQCEKRTREFDAQWTGGLSARASALDPSTASVRSGEGCVRNETAGEASLPIFFAPSVSRLCDSFLQSLLCDNVLEVCSSGGIKIDDETGMPGRVYRTETVPDAGVSVRREKQYSTGRLQHGPGRDHRRDMSCIRAVI